MHLKQKIARVSGRVLMLLVIVGCNLSIMVIVANSTVEESNSWLAKYGISLTQDLLLAQFLKALMQSWLIKRAAAYPRRRNQLCRKIMIRLIDKLILRALVSR